MNTDFSLIDIKKNGDQNFHINEGDYRGEDGSLYCGRCGKVKEMVVYPLDIPMTVHPICACEKEKLESELVAEELAEKLDEVKRLRAIGFPDAELRKWTFAADDKSNAWLTMVAQKYVEKFTEMKKEGKGLLFYGPVGTGKTFISACIANALIDKGFQCKVTNFATIVRELEEAYKNEGEQKYLNKLNEFDLIVIDDLGAERNTEYMTEKVTDIVDFRYRSGKPMIVTTNLTGQELSNAADIKRQRIYSRLREMCYPVKVDGADRRRAKASKNYRNTESILES